MMLHCFQIALVSTDLPASLRFYAEGLGYKSGGGTASWESRIQNLGPGARHIMWWMVGEQPFFQLELFNYTHPVVRPLAADWRPSDHGWTRFGVVVDNFDDRLERVLRLGAKQITAPVVKNGRRHVGVRDPYVGVYLELIESDPRKPSGPTMTYATSSVSDLEKARHFYGELLQFELLPLEQLHTRDDEALWGLPGAERHGFLARVDDVLLEIVQYRNPVGRPRPKDFRLSDQGIQNISLGARRAAPVRWALDRIKTAGYVPPFTFENGENVCGYIIDAERAFEIASIPEELDKVYGFEPSPIKFSISNSTRK
jgi:catechol 2,3-dioxygenase-like lactoylglutathione lyase family enzyme